MRFETNERAPLTPWDAIRDPSVIPWEIRDAVELWARQHGTHATIAWNSVQQCAVIDIDLKPDDPQMQAWQQGRIHWKPTETVLLNKWDMDRKGYVALDIHQLGVHGVLNLLNEGDVMSGNGRFPDLLSAVRFVIDHNQRNEEKQLAARRDEARAFARDMKNQTFHIPVITPGIDLKSETKDEP